MNGNKETTNSMNIGSIQSIAIIGHFGGKEKFVDGQTI